jgi:hypothetical protein
MPLALTCDNASKIKVTAHPDGPLDGALQVAVASGDGTVEPVDALSFYVVSGLAIADTVFSVTGDADPSSNVVPIADTITLTVTQKMASNLGLQADAPVPK